MLQLSFFEALFLLCIFKLVIILKLKAFNSNSNTSIYIIHIVTRCYSDIFSSSSFLADFQMHIYILVLFKVNFLFYHLSLQTFYLIIFFVGKFCSQSWNRDNSVIMGYSVNRHLDLIYKKTKN